MPQTATSIEVTGTLASDSAGAMLVLSKRLDGHDTFLSGQLQLDEHSTLAVRILTLDDVTVLRVIDVDALPDTAETWAGVLHLPHGWRPREVPADLDAAASTAHRDLTTLDTAELRYALTFLEEASTAGIRRQRIEAIVGALPIAPTACA